LLTIAALIAIVAIGLYLRYTGIRQHNAVLEGKNQLIQEEKKRSEDLLLNILPAAIADELKMSGAAIPRRYQTVSVLFADFKDFSKKIEDFSPDELIAELDFCFSAFDTIIEEYGLEKIKTIGDAYMCAGGLPTPDNQHPVRMIQAARDMQAFLEERKEERAAKEQPFFEARIGIHTGPIIAGVVGLKKFAYDIWGDTVNIASRLESNSEPGRINVSESTYQLVRNEFPCEYRGKIPTKNIGELDMYFVN
jgi:adenylate cyclase